MGIMTIADFYPNLVRHVVSQSATSGLSQIWLQVREHSIFFPKTLYIQENVANSDFVLAKLGVIRPFLPPFSQQYSTFQSHLLFSLPLLPTRKDKKQADMYIFNHCMHQENRKAILHGPCEKLFLVKCTCSNLFFGVVFSIFYSHLFTC